MWNGSLVSRIFFLKSSHTRVLKCSIMEPKVYLDVSYNCSCVRPSTELTVK